MHFFVILKTGPDR